MISFSFSSSRSGKVEWKATSAISSTAFEKSLRRVVAWIVVSSLVVKALSSPPRFSSRQFTW
jgi:hypothetical protein